MKTFLPFLALLPFLVMSQQPTTPLISHESGFYADEFFLNITHPDTNVTILYTLDGSEPKIENLTGKVWNYKTVYKTNPANNFGVLLEDTIWTREYTDSLRIYDRAQEDNITSGIPTSVYNHFLPNGTVFKSTVLKTVAYSNNEYSAVVVRNFFVTPLAQARYTMPVVSISVDNEKIYGYDQGLNVPGIQFDNWRGENPDVHFIPSAPANYQASGSSSEIKVHFSYIENGEEVLNHYAGLRLNGNYTRFFPNRAFRLYAKSSYGPSSFKHSFFKEYSFNKFKRLVLRNSGNDTQSTFFRDAFIQKLSKNLNVNIQESQPVILFINSEYNGIRNIRERYDEKYFERIFGIDENDLDFLENNGIADVGDDSYFVEMMNFYKNNSLVGDDNYKKALTYIDPVNFTDNFIVNIFIANDDWPHNNYEFWRKKVEYDSLAPYGHDGRFRWVLKDTDHGFDLNNTNRHKLNMMDWVTRILDLNEPNAEFYNSSNLLFRRLIENETYKNYFINRFADVLNTTFTVERSLKMIEEFKEIYQPEIEENGLRWDYFSQNLETWEEKSEILSDFALNRPYFQRKHISEKFELNGMYDLLLDVSDTAHGYIHVNTIDILPTTDGIENNPYIWSGVYFQGVPIHVTAVPKPGYLFSHWSGESNSVFANLHLTNSKDIYLKANFVYVKEPNHELSSNSVEQKEKLVVYPNPFADKLTILSDVYEGHYSIFSMDGKMLKQDEFNTSVIQVGELPKGLYILEVKTATSLYRQQIVKK